MHTSCPGRLTPHPATETLLLPAGLQLLLSTGDGRSAKLCLHVQLWVLQGLRGVDEGSQPQRYAQVRVGSHTGITPRSGGGGGGGGGGCLVAGLGGRPLTWGMYIGEYNYTAENQLFVQKTIVVYIHTTTHDKANGTKSSALRILLRNITTPQLFN